MAVENGLVAAHDAAAGALVPWLPGGVPFHEWEDEPMLRTYAAQRMQADGGLVFTHFQVGVCLAHTPLVDFASTSSQVLALC